MELFTKAKCDGTVFHCRENALERKRIAAMIVIRKPIIATITANF
jgi:hypothetical protein